MAYSKQYTIRVDTNKVIPAAARSDASPFQMLQSMRNLLGGIGSRNAQVAVWAFGDGTQATGTVTWTGAQATLVYTPCTSSTGTVTIAGVPFVADFDTSATQTVTNIKALIQANATVSALVSVSGTTTMTCTAVDYGEVGNDIAVSETGNGSWAGGATALAGGTPVTDMGEVVLAGHSVDLLTTGDDTTVAQAAAAAAAALNADAAFSNLAVATGAVVSHNVVVTITANVPPEQAELGNAMTLTADVGSASGATLSGGSNAAANSYNY